MKVKDVMVHDVSVCQLDNNLAETVATMWDARCGALPIVDANGAVLSMITDRDICIALGTRNMPASALRVKDVSLPRVFSCRPDDSVQAALRTMTSQDVRRLPVVDEAGKLVGILSIDDLLLHAEAEPGELSYGEIVEAAKSILQNRALGHVHAPAELVAVEQGLSRAGSAVSAAG